MKYRERREEREGRKKQEKKRERERKMKKEQRERERKRKEGKESKSHSWGRHGGVIPHNIYIFALHFCTAPEAPLIRNSFEITRNQFKKCKHLGG